MKRPVCFDYLSRVFLAIESNGTFCQVNVAKLTNDRRSDPCDVRTQHGGIGVVQQMKSFGSLETIQLHEHFNAVVEVSREVKYHWQHEIGIRGESIVACISLSEVNSILIIVLHAGGMICCYIMMNHTDIA